MTSWEMRSIDSFDEGEGDFDSVVKDDGVSDVNDEFEGESEEELEVFFSFLLFVPAGVFFVLVKPNLLANRSFKSPSDRVDRVAK